LSTSIHHRLSALRRTSITLDLLSAHEDFARVSNLLNEFPRKLELSSFNRVFDSERGAFLLLNRHQVRTLAVPVEPGGFGLHIYEDFDGRREASCRHIVTTKQISLQKKPKRYVML
jgi:hypothetical protein